MENQAAEKKIAELDQYIIYLTEQLRLAERDQKNPLSHVFPSQKIGWDNAPADLRKQLENAQLERGVMLESKKSPR